MPVLCILPALVTFSVIALAFKPLSNINRRYDERKRHNLHHNGKE